MRLDCDLAYGPILVNRRGSRGECGFRAVIDNFLGDRWVYRHLENVFTIVQLGIVNVARQAVDAQIEIATLYQQGISDPNAKLQFWWAGSHRYT